MKFNLILMLLAGVNLMGSAIKFDLDRIKF